MKAHEGGDGMNNRKSVYIRQWNWEMCDVSIWRNRKWGKEYHPTKASRRRLRKITSLRQGNFKKCSADLGLHSMTLWAHDYDEPEPEPATEIAPSEEFFTPNLEPDVLAPYWDYRETMDDFIESTRS